MVLTFASVLCRFAPLSLLTLAAVSLPGACRSQPDSPAPAQAEPVPVLLISGANNHEWEWTAPSLERILEESGRFAVTLTKNPSETLEDAEGLKRYRAFVLDYNGPMWSEAARRNFLAAVTAGTGVTVIHASNNAFPGWEDYEKLVALCWRKGTGHGRFHAFDVKVVDHDHPITKGMPDMRMHPDELYHRLVHMHGTGYRLLATAHSSKKSGGTGNDEPMILVKNWGKGRVFHTPLGHVWKNVPATRASHADPQFRSLVCRGTEWAATGEVGLPAQPMNFLTAEEKQAGFRLLFNGRDLKGWRGYKKKGLPGGWTVHHGALGLPRGARGGDLITVDQFGDFELRFEWKVAPKSNSGVIYRVRETQKATYQTGPEYQVLDDAGTRPGAKTSAGSLYALDAPKGKTLRPVGSFNTGRVVLRAGRLEHWVNGVKVVDTTMGDDSWTAKVQASKFKTMPEFGVHPTGHIAFQDHGGEVWYRTVRIREFGSADKK